MTQAGKSLCFHAYILDIDQTAFLRFPSSNIFLFIFRYSATGGADSGPGSLEGSPIDDKEEGQQAFGGGEWFYLLN